MAKRGGDQQQNLNDIQEIIEAKKALENEMSRSFSSLFDGLKKEQQIRKNILSLEKEINNIQKIIAEREFNGIKISREELKLLEERKNSYKQIVGESKYLVNNLDKQKALMQSIKNESSQVLKNFSLFSANGKAIIGYMDQQDGLVRKLNLELGITNSLSNSYGLSLLKSAEYSARLGLSAGDLVSIQREYVNETGKLSQLNKQNFDDIAKIAAGTSMAANEAGKLVGQFELFGLGVSESKKVIEDLVNDAGAYGISSGKLLNSISKNIDKVNKYNFKNGVKGLADMVKYSERFKIDMDGVFTAMDKSRTLEGSLDMASKLMVLGGKFSESDPFKLMFLSRNDPAKYQEAISKMTEGTAVFNKSTKQFEIGAYDLDRLRAASEATGIAYDELAGSAKRFASIKMAKNQLFVGNKEEREMIASIAKMDGKGKFQVDVGGKLKDLSTLTAQDIKLLEQQKQTLEQRALASQNFDETLKNLILELKATLLPLLQYTAKALETFKTIINATRSVLPDGSFKYVAMAAVAAGTLFSAAVALKSAFSVGQWVMGGSSKGAGMASTVASKGMGGGTDITTGGGASPAGTTANYARAASIAAIGVAAVGIGFGINLAAKGFAYLGETMGKLDLKTQNKLLAAMAITFGGMAGLILAAGVAGNAALPGLLGIAAAVSSIGLASSGIGFMIDKLNNFTNPEAKMIDSIKNVDFQPMKSAFMEANRFLSADLGNLTKLKKEIENIKDIDFSQTKKLLNTLNNGIELRLPKGAEMTMTINNIIDIDGEQIVKKNTRTVMLEITNSKRGRGALSM